MGELPAFGIRDSAFAFRVCDDIETGVFGTDLAEPRSVARGWVHVQAHLNFGTRGPPVDFVGAHAQFAGEGVEVAAEFEVAKHARDVVGGNAGEVCVGQLCWACHVWSP